MEGKVWWGDSDFPSSTWKFQLGTQKYRLQPKCSINQDCNQMMELRQQMTEGPAAAKSENMTRIKKESAYKAKHGDCLANGNILY